MHQKDRALLELIKTSLGVGQIYKHGRDSIVVRVGSVKDLLVIIDHFDKYPLITQKLADYILFKRVLELMNRQEHLTVLEGLNKVVAIKASINKGLSSAFKAAFPNIQPVARPLVPNQSIPHPQWLAGFTSGEGCFYISIGKPSSSGGSAIRLRFILTQHNRDNELMGSLVEYLACGGYFPHPKHGVLDFVADRKIIPNNLVVVNS